MLNPYEHIIPGQPPTHPNPYGLRILNLLRIIGQSLRLVRHSTSTYQSFRKKSINIPSTYLNNLLEDEYRIYNYTNNIRMT